MYTCHLHVIYAVSYTHLDVYKRQFILNDILHYMSYEHQRTLLLRCMERLRPEGKLIAVSYTHLDVYKRQVYGSRPSPDSKQILISQNNIGRLSTINNQGEVVHNYPEMCIRDSVMAY